MPDFCKKMACSRIRLPSSWRHEISSAPCQNLCPIGVVWKLSDCGILPESDLSPRVNTCVFLCSRVFGGEKKMQEGCCTSIGRSIASLGTCTARQHSDISLHQRTESELHQPNEIVSQICPTTMAKVTFAVGTSMPLICSILRMSTMGQQAQGFGSGVRG